MFMQNMSGTRLHDKNYQFLKVFGGVHRCITRQGLEEKTNGTGNQIPTVFYRTNTVISKYSGNRSPSWRRLSQYHTGSIRYTYQLLPGPIGYIYLGEAVIFWIPVCTKTVWYFYIPEWMRGHEWCKQRKFCLSKFSLRSFSPRVLQ